MSKSAKKKTESKAKAEAQRAELSQERYLFKCDAQAARKRAKAASKRPAKPAMSAEQAKVAAKGFFVLREHWSKHGSSMDTVVWHLLSGEDRVSPVPAWSNEVRRFATRKDADECLARLGQHNDLYVAFVPWDAVHKAQEAKEDAEMLAGLRRFKRLMGGFFG